MGSISNGLCQHLAYSLPAYMKDTIVHLIHTHSADPDGWLVLAHTQFLVQDLNVEGEISPDLRGWIQWTHFSRKISRQ